MANTEIQYSLANICVIPLKKVHYFLSQDCSNGWSMGHTRLEFLPLLLCPCSQKSFFQGWWWCLQLSTGSWASPNISLDDYSNLEMCTFGRSSSFVCLFFVLFLSYHKASFHYFSRCFRWCLKPFQIKFSQDSLVLSRPEQSVSAWQRR